MKKSKIIWNKILRMAVMGGGVAVGIAGSVMAYRMSRPYEETVETPLIGYSITVEPTYRVHMQANSLYEGEWMEEGALFSSELTDYVEIHFMAGAVLTGQAQVSGEYTVTAILEGYQMRGDTRRVVYNKTYPLGSGKAKETQSSHVTLDKVLKIVPSEYSGEALKADDILGASVSRDFRVEFAGMIIIEGEEKPFSCQVNIPVSEDSFYDITKTEASTEDGAIQETSLVTVTPKAGVYLPYIGVGILGVMVSLFTFLLTRAPRGQEELWEEKLRGLMRRHGSRCISLEAFPDEGKREILLMGDMNGLIAVAEELRCPIACSLNEKGLPKEGKFCVFNQAVMYMFQIKKEEKEEKEEIEEVEE